jgi:hypothetical protein
MHPTAQLTRFLTLGVAIGSSAFPSACRFLTFLHLVSKLVMERLAITTSTVDDRIPGPQPTIVNHAAEGRVRGYSEALP